MILKMGQLSIIYIVLVLVPSVIVFCSTFRNQITCMRHLSDPDPVNEVTKHEMGTCIAEVQAYKQVFLEKIYGALDQVLCMCMCLRKYREQLMSTVSSAMCIYWCTM